MSRSGYSDECDDSGFAMYRGQVASAIRGKRGQAFLKELRDSLLALPEKSLTADSMAFRASPADPDGAVCAVGSLALRRKIAEGKTRTDAVTELREEWKGCDGEECGDSVASEFNIAEQLAREVMYENDEACYDDRETGEHRYRRMLAWVNRNIKE